jgi:hypothetical protein
MRTTTAKLSQRLISDKLLRDLAQGDPMRALGEISAEDQAILCMTLPDLCGELLAYRLAYSPLPHKQTASPTRRLLLALQRAGRFLSSRPARAPIAGGL